MTLSKLSLAHTLHSHSANSLYDQPSQLTSQQTYWNFQFLGQTMSTDNLSIWCQIEVK